MLHVFNHPTETLHQRAKSIRAVQGVEMNAFSRALRVLEQIAEEIDAPLAIARGLAGIHHGALVTTVDIDVVVPQDRLDDFLQCAQEQALVIRKRSPAGWHSLVFEDPEQSVAIEVIPEGGRTPRDPEYAPPVPSLRALGVERGLGYVSFAGWVTMKLVAARDKDRYHLTEALKHKSAEQIAEVVQLLRPLHASYLVEFNRLLRAARDENQENW